MENLLMSYREVPPPHFALESLVELVKNKLQNSNWDIEMEILSLGL